MSDESQNRFSGLARLYGEPGLAALRRAHVAVIGIGGVGSWTAEALARSGVGELTLVDLDDVCVTNTYQQIHALSDTVGQSKVQVMAERIATINPECTLHAEECFLTGNNVGILLDRIPGCRDRCHRCGPPQVPSPGPMPPASDSGHYLRSGRRPVRCHSHRDC
jgi:tRNA A37 threonylcarbamoyladenosine dehydratase